MKLATFARTNKPDRVESWPEVNKLLSENREVLQTLATEAIQKAYETKVSDKNLPN